MLRFFALTISYQATCKLSIERQCSVFYPFILSFSYPFPWIFPAFCGWVWAVLSNNDYSRDVSPVIEIYSDRLCIISFGGLVNDLYQADFFKGRSIPRNRELMRIFRDLNFVEHLGIGMEKILNTYDKSIFNISDNFLEVCFPYTPDYMNLSDQNTIDKKEQVGEQVGEQVREQVGEQVRKLIIIIDGERSLTELMTSLNLKGRRNFIEKYLSPAVLSGYIEFTQPNSPKSPTQKYRLSKKGLTMRNNFKIK